MASNFDTTWAALDPADDWAAQVIQSIFPVSSGSAPLQIGTVQTVIGTMLGHLAGFALCLAAAFVCYGIILQIHRAAEAGRVLSETTSSWWPVRTDPRRRDDVPTRYGVQRRSGWCREGLALGYRYGPQPVSGHHPSHWAGRDANRAADDPRHEDRCGGPHPVGDVPRAYQRCVRPAEHGSRAEPGDRDARVRRGWICHLELFPRAGNETAPPVCGTVTIRAPLQGATNLGASPWIWRGCRCRSSPRSSPNPAGCGERGAVALADPAIIVARPADGAPDDGERELHRAADPGGDRITQSLRSGLQPPTPAPAASGCSTTRPACRRSDGPVREPITSNRQPERHDALAVLGNAGAQCPELSRARPRVSRPISRRSRQPS